jgi:hypothetical protein
LSNVYQGQSDVAAGKARIQSDAARHRQSTGTSRSKDIRGHLTEYGWIAPKRPSHVAMLADLIEEEEMAARFPKQPAPCSD